MTEGPVVVMALEREDAIKHWREVMGATNPAKAADGTIRKQFAHNIERNACMARTRRRPRRLRSRSFSAWRRCCRYRLPWPLTWHAVAAP